MKWCVKIAEKESEIVHQKEDYDEDEIKELIRKYEEGEIEEKTPEMEEYEKETGKYAIWRGVVTEGFKKWLKGEKIYDRDKERISLYVSDNTKEEWQEFIKDHNYSTISKLIRESVNYFIDQKSSLIKDNIFKMDLETIGNISHALKEPLTSIKGFSQLLLENYRKDLSEDVLLTIENIFEQSLLLEGKIVNILDDIKVEASEYDILLIEDDLATIRLLTSYFESKGYTCKGVISGTKGIEELKHSQPKVILLDIILPDLSGYDLCKMIKSDKTLREIPVYLLTAIPGSEVEKKLDETKADGYILKPFDFSDFAFILDYLTE
ncbi:MAG: response regulator [Candidatus Lokiarchaeota archaeon]|nr:response regulator [Candidatus Lokiarchaeota archaeon]MBD3199319.1 response regulator [Candidatus Lokiarchaeota archaeon]